jgi:type I restriction enzyme S subunit
VGEWATMRVGDLAAPERNSLVGGPFGSDLITSDYVSDGVPVIRGENLSNGRWVGGPFVFVTPGKAQRLSANMAGPLDVVFTQRGANHYRQVAMVPADSERMLISQSQMKLTVDGSKADPLFVYYAFRSPALQEYLKRHAIQTGVPHTNLAILRAAPIPLPPLEDQRRIALILGALDDKIELNRRMNKTLEAIARALFKSWFVDFDPVHAKSECRDSGLPAHLADLFPDAFEDSELGEIPKGWRVAGFGDVAERLRDQENPLSSPDVLFNHYSIPAFDDGQSAKPEYGESIKSLKSRVPAGAILLSKLNPEIERVWMVDISAGERAVCSTEFLVLRALSPFTRSFVYCLARSPKFRQQIEALVTGTSKSHQRAQAHSVLSLAVVIPPRRLVEAFEGPASSQFSRTLECRRESRTLAALRDVLLPKLISGGLRVKDAERIAAGTNA